MEEFVNFPDFAFQLAEQLSRSVFVDQVRATTERREQVLKLLREHVKDNIVKVSGCICPHPRRAKRSRRLVVNTTDKWLVYRKGRCCRRSSASEHTETPPSESGAEHFSAFSTGSWSETS